MEIQRMIDNLLLSIEWDEAAKNSYTNFHVKGLSYLNLLRTARLTVKLYTLNHVQLNAQGYLVHPHTHGYSFSHRTMVGNITNHRFAVTDRNGWMMYAFMTPLNGGSGLSKMLPCGLIETIKDFCRPRQSYYLDHKDIHTISTTSDYAAALLIQYHDVKPGSPTVMFAPIDESPECLTGLYYPMSVYEGRMMVERYHDMLSDGGKDETNF